MIKERQLNLNDLGEALRMPPRDAETLAAPIIADLRKLKAPAGLDQAGIPRRGGDVFREVLEGRSLLELRAAYVTLRRLNCQAAIIDQLEIVRGSSKDSEDKA